MEPSFRLINPQANRSFIFKYEPLDLTMRWHYHPEVELLYFTEGKITALIGDIFREFNQGDVLILGANCPHVLQENKEFKKDNPTASPVGIVLQFTPNFLGDGFMERPEFQAIGQFLNKAKRGVHIRAAMNTSLASALTKMPAQGDTEKVLNLLSVLHNLSAGDGYEYITTQDYFFDHSQDEERMRKVNEFVYRYFREKITIADVARVASLTETAFCRYFKSRTRKHFTRFLNEVRVAYACKLLHKKNYSVTDVCFESGFNSLSYFNRQFTEVMNMSPKKYQQEKLKTS
ncbi:AraC family transcriptional regulator [Mucilaginibacter conchicola]|uniref:AraC family transcriptional regulator n=1 Tax=Mucilaginibacter conchicola TaxID=2303333 RepID=A0A372NWS2_9SPHI|nr:AraC family transcriptional regulator [Mucilaginibacter conchicola]RFZ94472.1 AraC family transcriptional regulator [Mucilaginibacter conchicola]